MTPTHGPTLRQRLRYRVDNALSRGIWVVLAWLGLGSLLLFVLVALVISVVGIGPDDQPASFPEGVWLALTRFLDAGTFTGDTGVSFRLLMLAVTLVGIFIAATIIGVISSGIDARIEALRRGRSFVVESGHTVVIGRSDKLGTIIAELVEANASQRDAAVVVLTPDDVVEVGEDIRSLVPDLKTTRLVVRSGTTTRIQDLAQVNPATAKSVIVLRVSEHADAHVVKTVLALTRLMPETEGPGIVAEIDDPDTADALRTAIGARLVTVTPTDVIARIGAQVARAAGLGAVYQELLDFDGDEMYMIDVPPGWSGRSYGEALLASTTSTIIGVMTASGATLNPPMSTRLGPGDRLIGIAEDDSTFALDAEPVDWIADDDRRWAEAGPLRERTLIIGWSELAPLIAQELEGHVSQGSELHVMVDPAEHDADAVRAALDLDLHQLVVHEGDPIRHADIARVLGGGPFNHVLLLSERQHYDMAEADARTLLALLHVRSVLDGSGTENVVAELLDPNDVELVGAREGAPAASDFIVSQRLISLLIAQLSETPQLATVFTDLFDAEGATIALHPVERYVPHGEATFAQIVEAGRAFNVTAIGYRAASAAEGSGGLGGGIRVNPPKPEPVTLAPGDAVIVIGRP